MRRSTRVATRKTRCHMIAATSSRGVAAQPDLHRGNDRGRRSEPGKQQDWLRQTPEVPAAAGHLQDGSQGQFNGNDLEQQGDGIENLQPNERRKWGPRRLPDHGQASRDEAGEAANRLSLVLRWSCEVHRVDFTHGCIVGLLERARGELGEADWLSMGVNLRSGVLERVRHGQRSRFGRNTVRSRRN